LKAILLAGGLGTRLRSIISDIPKPMAPVNGRPFLELLLNYILDQGIDEIVFSVGYRHEVIQSHFGDTYRGCSLHYAIEESPRGTGGAISLALEGKEGSEPWFVLNADTYIELNLAEMRSSYVRSGQDVAMALKYLHDTSRYGRVTVNDAGLRIQQFEEKEGSRPGLVNMGVYLLRPEIFNRFQLPEAFSLENDLFVKELNTISITPFITDGYFIDIGVPEDYLRAQHEMRIRHFPS